MNTEKPKQKGEAFRGISACQEPQASGHLADYLDYLVFVLHYVNYFPVMLVGAST